MSRNRLALSIRLAKLIHRLQREHVRPTVPQLASWLGVHERTIHRDIATLSAAHIPMPPTVDQVEAL